MKISLDRDVLLTQLQAAIRVASTRSAIQALSGVQLVVQGSVSELRATDADVSLRLPITAETESEGAILVPGRLLADIIRSCDHPTVTLTSRFAEQDLEIVCGNASFHIRTMRVDDFPPLPEPNPAAAVHLPLHDFLDTALKVAGSASRDETRPVLTGVLVSVAGRDLRMVATDSYRLSVKETRLPDSVTTGFEANIPARALHELVRLGAHASEDDLIVSLRQNQIVFAIGAAILSSRLLDGQFPNYRQLLPETFEHELRMSGPELRDVVRRVSLLAQKNAPLRLSFTTGEVTVSSQTPDIGEAREALPTTFQGEPFEIGFNPEFLREGLDAIGDGDVIVKLLTPLRPGLFEAGDGSGFVYLIMPIRLNV
ncbi:MAG: DNA polymerase III subunit beta [Actinomycetota bacterium]|nr:DNA polymerase III subunit beta [Actinomycetota bacterium]